MTRFLIDSTDAISQYFKSANHNEEILLYRLDDVYNQIERIVENVSYNIYCQACMRTLSSRPTEHLYV